MAIYFLLFANIIIAQEETGTKKLPSGIGFYSKHVSIVAQEEAARIESSIKDPQTNIFFQSL